MAKVKLEQVNPADLNKIQKFERKPLPPGMYRAKVVCVEPNKETGEEIQVSAKGNQYIRWRLETITNDHQTNKRWLSYTTTLTGPGRAFWDRFVEACGLNNPADIDTNELLNKVVVIQVAKGDVNPVTKEEYPSKIVDVSTDESFDAFSDIGV